MLGTTNIKYIISWLVYVFVKFSNLILQEN